MGDFAVLLRRKENDHIPNSNFTAVVGFNLEFIPGSEGRVHARAGVGYSFLFYWFDWFGWFDWFEARLNTCCVASLHGSSNQAQPSEAIERQKRESDWTNLTNETN